MTTTTETNHADDGIQKKCYVGGYLDPLLAQRLQDVADKTARGNRTMVLERYVREGLEREKILAEGVRHPNT